MNLTKKFNNLDKYTKLAIIIILIGTIVRFSLAMIYHVSGDACWHMSVARFIANNDFKIPLFEPLGRGVFWVFPFFHFIAAILYKIFFIFGENAAESSMKFISPIFGSLTLVLIFQIAKKLYNKKIAFYATLFLTFLPISIYYSSISFLGSTVSFFVALSVLFMLKKRVVISAISVSIAILTKYIAIFILPLLLYLLYINNKDKKEVIKKIFILGLIIFIALVPWFARNYLMIGNPVYPFFDSTGSEETFSGISPSNLFNLDNLSRIYLGLFGIPHGKISSFSFIDIPLLELFLAGWLIFTILFSLPFFIGIFTINYKKNSTKMLIIWISSFIIGLLIYIMNVGVAYPRLLLACLAAIAIIWALGLEKIMNNLKKYKKIIKLFLVCCIIMFISVEFIKFTIAANAWEFYSEDFNWVKENTNKEDVFMVGGQCIHFNINRFTIDQKEDINDANYIWYNKNFKLDPASILKKETIDEIDNRNLKQAYYNQKTGTRIYEIN